MRKSPAGAVKCIVGLGNPGTRYSATRHNVGYRVIGALKESLRVSLRPGKGDFSVAKIARGSDTLLLAMPTTFMNDSGRAVAEIMQEYQVAASNCLIVLDDFQLPIGTVRMRPSGSDGGHNGLASIIYHTETNRIPRLRVGVAGKTMPVGARSETMATYVLSPFDQDEERMMKWIVELARDACIYWAEHGIRSAMNNFNKAFDVLS